MGSTWRTLAILAGLGAVVGALREAETAILFGLFACALGFIALGAWWDAFDARTRSEDAQQRPADAPPAGSSYWTAP